MTVNIFVLLAAYLLGSIPFGLLITRAAGLGDVRSIGSGNIGATNVMRTGKKELAALTLLMDMAKGYAAVLVAAYGLLRGDIGDYMLWVHVAAMTAILGHVFPVWLQFKGGKGVATAIGALLALDPLLVGYYAVFWLILLLATRMVSVASVLAFWFLLAISYATAVVTNPLFLLLVAALITWRHRANIERLRKGTEPRIGRKKNV